MIGVISGKNVAAMQIILPGMNANLGTMLHGSGDTCHEEVGSAGSDVTIIGNIGGYALTAHKACCFHIGQFIH